MNIEKLKVTCELCPAQLEGETDDGYFIYARIRHSRFSVTISKTLWDDKPDEYVLSGNLPGEYATGNPELLRRLVELYVELINNG